ncbi:zinc finger CCCH domain-containing protein 67 isoform X2 [Cinnamomum micranthum f. kanehirae]|uniref:Zinc finger CCCH domain-containing protein 67 isoform X2 n=1 Tax=Cinnamomum micranthum f. kanehirae TaxID=337451 RepID=A0A443Q1Q5_9MAGN|nr:zinc finger CCCH domain-containing protein 67 isoform X2 [Cinnamomum micranthum f. kanehirae]
MGGSEDGDPPKMEEELGLGLQSTARPPSPSIDSAIASLNEEFQDLGLKENSHCIESESASSKEEEEEKDSDFKKEEEEKDSHSKEEKEEYEKDSDLKSEKEEEEKDSDLKEEKEEEEKDSDLKSEKEEEEKDSDLKDEKEEEEKDSDLKEKKEEEEKDSDLKEQEQEEEKDSDSKEEEKKDGRFQYPIRRAEPDCLFYLRTGTCKFGLNCKFNHPPRQRNQVGTEGKWNEKENEKEEGKEKEKEENEDKYEGNEHENEEFPEREGQPECKYYLKTGGCKFGKACRYNHPREKAGVGEPVELNFLGLPMRPGEKECPFYMRTGSCKFATNCRFHHPDPTAVGGCDPLPVYQNDSSVTLHASRASPPLPTAWSRTSNERVPYMEASPPPYVPVMLPPPHVVHPNPDWNGFMGPGSALYPPERNLRPPSASAMIDLTKKADSSIRQHQPMVEEFPERPGQQECQFYMKTGNCKFKSACRYHHPKSRLSNSPATCVLSSMGLPLRPDQMICMHYNRYGICKFGPACKYDHPINYGPGTPVTSATNQTPLD